VEGGGYDDSGKEDGGVGHIKCNYGGFICVNVTGVVGGGGKKHIFI